MTVPRSRHVRREEDACVVPTEPLCGVLTGFVDNWRKTRKSRKGQWGNEDMDFGPDPMNPYEWLAFDTGIPEAQIRKIKNVKRNPYTELSIADSLVASIGEPSMFYGDEPLLRVMPNPAAARERWGECCGGSEPVRVRTEDMRCFLRTPYR